jgi:hypothetical protein
MGGEKVQPWQVRLELCSLKNGHPQGTAQWRTGPPVAFSGWLELAHVLELSEPGRANHTNTASEQALGSEGMLGPGGSAGKHGGGA